MKVNFDATPSKLASSGINRSEYIRNLILKDIKGENK
jgi:hypothetical protein